MYEAHTAEGPIAFATTLNFSAVSKATLSRCILLLVFVLRNIRRLLKNTAKQRTIRRIIIMMIHYFGQSNPHIRSLEHKPSLKMVMASAIVGLASRSISLQRKRKRIGVLLKNFIKFFYPICLLT